MGELFSQLGVNWKILIAQLINFGILIFVLRWLLYKPLLGLLAKRQKKLETNAEHSAALEQKIAATTAAEEKILAEARKRGQALLMETEKTGQALKESLLIEAKKEVVKMLAAGQQTLAEERVKLRRELKQEIGAVVTLAIENSLGDVLDDKIQKRLEKETMEKITN